MFDDKQLKQAVLDEMIWEPSVNAAHIGVTAKAGVVTLMGHVETYSEKSAAEKAARRVRDVKAVVEEIEVKLPFDIKRGDAEIAAAAVDRLGWNPAFSGDPVKVKVEKGWITLTGEVNWHYQKEVAEDEIAGLWGVIGVSNQITIKSRPNASNIKDNIMVALQRSWFDPTTINVNVEGGAVNLTGTVHKWTERAVAASTAWAAPGTTSVQNNINVH
jgi:osmotically-inducible protein OsmY